MPPAPEDLAFTRYCATADPHALSEVFDRTAGKLLLVAMHLCRDEASAEDLVQATFVAAMHARQRFAPGRRVLPWLLGILAHEASGQRRRAARAARFPGREDVDPGTPHAALLATELQEQLAHALATLPEVYRVVLDLRFVHGLRSVQIARTLGRSPETVRTQVRRGLAHLRRILPRSLAVPVALVAVRGRGLAAVRTQLVAQARALTAGSAAPAGIGMAWGAVLALGLVFLCSAVLGSSAEPIAAPASATVMRAAQAHQDTTARQETSDPQRATVPTASAAAADRNGIAPRSLTAVPAALHLLGRCLAEETREPLAGCRIRLTCQDGSQREAASDATGAFTLDLPEWPTDTRAALQVTAPDRFPLYARLAGFDPRTQADLGDILLPRGIPVSGTVVDPEGTPLAGLALTCQRAPLDGPPLGRWRGEWLMALATTDARGGFTLGMPLLAGQWRLQLDRKHDRDFDLVAPQVLVADEHLPQPAVRVVVRRLDPSLAITGTVLDDRGQPVPDRTVTARALPDRWQPLGQTRTDAQGRFELPCRADPGRKVVLIAQDNVSLTDPMPETAWGTRGVQLVVPAQVAALSEVSGDLELEVLDAQGQPVEAFAVRCCADPRACSRFLTAAGALRLAGHHPGGRVVLAASTRWRNVLFVVPDDPRLAPAGPVFCDAGSTRIRVVLRPWRELRVRVVRTDGSPVAGTHVELLRPWGQEPVDLATTKVPLADPFATPQVHPWCICLAEADTDADGVAALRAGTGESDLVLRLPGPRHRPLLRSHVAAGGDRPLVVTVESGATLIGRLHGWEQLREYDTRGQQPLDGRFAHADPDWRRPTLILSLPDARAPFFYIPHLIPRHAIAADGSFRMEGLPPGTWAVHLFCQVGAWPQPTRLFPALASVTLAADQTRSLDLDGAVLIPGRVRGRMQVDGQPLAHTRWTLITTDPYLSSYIGDLDAARTDGDGRFDARPIVPGTYRVRVQWPDPRTGHLLQLDALEPITVAPGQDVEGTVRFASDRGVDFTLPPRR